MKIRRKWKRRWAHTASVIVGILGLVDAVAQAAQGLPDPKHAAVAAMVAAAAGGLVKLLRPAAPAL